MAKLSIVAGATSQSVNVFIQNSSLTTGAGLTGLVFNTASLVAYYTFTGANATSVAITLATLAAVNSAFSSGGFKEIDATNMPGLYRLDIPNAGLATSKGRSVTIMLKGAANMVPCVLEVELTGLDNQDGVRAGLTALPNAAAAASGGLPTIGATIPNATAGAAGGLFIAGTNAATTITTSFTTTFTGNLTGSVGSVTGLTASNLDATISSRMATYTQPTGFLAAIFPSGTLANTTNITAGTITTATNLTNAPTVGDFTAAMKTSLSAATPAVTVSDKTGFSLTAAYDPAKTASQAGDAMALTSGERTTLSGVVYTTAMTEAYPTLNGTLTIAKAMYNINQLLSERGISGTTLTTKKRDQSTTAKTFTLDSATAPASQVEAS